MAFRSSPHGSPPGGSPPGRSPTSLHPAPILTLLTLPLLGFLFLPLLAIFLRITPAQIWENLLAPQVWQAIRLSLWTSLLATIITITIGLPVAYRLASRPGRFSRLADVLIDLPVVLPPAVAGLGLLMAFGRNGLLGSGLSMLGVQVVFTSAAVVLAQTFVAAPYFVKSATLGFAQVNPEIRQAAALDGAGSWQTFWYIVLPLSWNALVSGALTTWARALGEFGATILFAGNFPGRTQTMPLAIYLGFETDLAHSLTLAMILVVLSSLVLVLVKVALQSRGGAESEHAYLPAP